MDAWIVPVHTGTTVIKVSIPVANVLAVMVSTSTPIATIFATVAGAENAMTTISFAADSVSTIHRLVPQPQWQLWPCTLVSGTSCRSQGTGSGCRNLRSHTRPSATVSVVTAIAVSLGHCHSAILNYRSYYLGRHSLRWQPLSLQLGAACDASVAATPTFTAAIAKYTGAYVAAITTVVRMLVAAMATLMTSAAAAMSLTCSHDPATVVVCYYPLGSRV